MIDDAQRPLWPAGAAVTAADSATREDLLARYKRASLGQQAMRAVWHLGALVRRVEREAPEIHGPLRDAVGALLLLAERLGSQGRGDRPSRRAAAAAEPDQTGLPAGAPDPSQPTAPRAFRQGELF